MQVLGGWKPTIADPFRCKTLGGAQVINGNNAAPIHSDFVGNSIRDLRVSAGDTAWKHEVIMPIGVLARHKSHQGVG